MQVVGPIETRVLDRTITVKIPFAPRFASRQGEGKGNPEPPLAQLCFAEDVAVDGPTGRYRFLATFQRGAAAAGGETEFYITDPAEMPAVETPSRPLGRRPRVGQVADRARHPHSTVHAGPARSPRSDPGIGKTRRAGRGRGVPRNWPAASPAGRRSCSSPRRFSPGAIGRSPGSPLTKKGTLSPIVGWLYLKDEWCKRHPIFEGMPSGGLMEYNYYREIIPDLVWSGQDPPAEAVAGAIKASQDYASGLMLAVYDLGEGRLILNTLRIRENLGRHPAAEQLLRNLLRYAARDVKKPLGSLPADFEQQLKAMGF